ncbi:MAG TPA: hypothetical protein DCM23_00955 [Firmicutes bacterium]|jgi:multisubunit Na+/H+ antiporter MnhF subunit|nr:hypothetical protein [Bacillota bacterium]HAV19624.1 hypothetical protein [Bacillota bacterium]
MKSFIKAFDDLPFFLKIIFALPGLDFLWGIYRLIKGIDTKSNLLILAGIVWILLGWGILWIIDLITIILYKKITILAD